jgi:hypothetical protein
MDKRTIDTLALIIAQQVTRNRLKGVTGGEIIAAVSDELPGLEYEQASQLELAVQNKLKGTLEIYFSEYDEPSSFTLEGSIAVPITPHP